ncbi:MAG: DUF4262 domain-containing protein [Rhodoblastus sp.]|nr:DUF4262 domain-containing protein [Rhodoblastus sp.]MCC2106201.1 DUF4262 domain-containing protein [Hyphomicrobiales bacterium]HPG04863.1 DUF4262 domain-containing protein [Rhodoblastus sp.]
MSTPSPEDFARFAAQTQQRIDDLVEKGSWLVVFVGADKQTTPPTPGFSYTVGLTEHGLPELVIAALPPDVAHGTLNQIGALMRKNGPFKNGDISYEVLQGNFRVAFVDLPGGALPIANARYGADDYHALQVFWPDPNGRLPWEPDIQQRLFGVGLVAPRRGA